MESPGRVEYDNFSKFTRKLLCWSLIFNEVACWKNSENLIENTYARVFFHRVADWRYNINIKSLIHLHFFNAPVFLHHLNNVLSLITVKSGNCLLSANIISNVGSLSAKQKSKPNATMTFAQSRQSRWISFLDLELGQAMLKFCLLEIQQISFFLWAISLRWKTFLFLFMSKGIHYPPLDRFYYFRKRVPIVCFPKRILLFFAFYLPYQWKFKVQITHELFECVWPFLGLSLKGTLMQIGKSP